MFPLKNKIAVVMRAQNQAAELSEKLKKLGAKVISFPTIKIVPPDDWKEVDSAIRSIKSFDYLIFTSVNAVKFFNSRYSELFSQTDYSFIKIIVVGNKTKNVCEQLGLHVDLIPENFSSKGIIRQFGSLLSGKKILYPGSSIGKEEFITELKQLGSNVIAVDIYKTIIPERSATGDIIEKLRQIKVDIYIFTSPSIFENYLTLMNINDAREYFHGKVVAAIGPRTKQALEKENVVISIFPAEYTTEGLVNSIANFYS